MGLGRLILELKLVCDWWVGVVKDLLDNLPLQ